MPGIGSTGGFELGAVVHRAHLTGQHRESRRRIVSASASCRVTACRNRIPIRADATHGSLERATYGAAKEIAERSGPDAMPMATTASAQSTTTHAESRDFASTGAVATGVSKNIALTMRK